MFSKRHEISSYKNETGHNTICIVNVLRMLCVCKIFVYVHVFSFVLQYPVQCYNTLLGNKNISKDESVQQKTYFG